MGGVTMEALAVVLALAASVATAQLPQAPPPPMFTPHQQQLTYLVNNNLCLTLGSDMQTVQLFPCGMYVNQQWDVTSGDRIQLGSHCLDIYPGTNGGLQIKPCNNALTQTWWFGSDGRISNKAYAQNCIQTQGTTGSTLALLPCSQSSGVFYATKSIPQVQQQFPQQAFGVPPQQPQPLPMYEPPTQQQLFGNVQPSPPQQQPFGNVQPSPPQQQQQYQAPPTINQAFSAPQQSHPEDRPSIKQAFLPHQQPQQPPTPPPTTPQIVVPQIPPHLSVQQPPPGQSSMNAAPVDISNDHYLCVCIIDATAEACNEAVRAACTVGHLDDAACRLSFSTGKHDRIADEILKVIANGARCSTFDQEQLKDAAHRKHTNLPGAAFKPALEGMPTEQDHYLCVCLDARHSEKCLAAVKAACLVGHIPAGSCYASLSKDNDGITDHILRLIDSGANCPQKLELGERPKSESKRSFFSRVFGKKTISNSDRDLCACLDDHESALCGEAIKQACKKKKIPKEDCDVAKNNNYLGGVTKYALQIIDHGTECPAHRAMTFTNHGCHCLQTWSDQGQTYHFPNNCADPGGKKGFAWCKTFKSEHCAGVEGSIEWDRCDNPKFPVRRDVDPTLDELNTEQDEHYLCICLSSTSTDAVCIAAVKAACEVGHLPQAACRDSFENHRHQAVSDMVVNILEGGARCKSTLATFQGSVIRAKSGETECPKGYYNFPNCKKKIECSRKCPHGSTCDFSKGRCECLPNFTGPRCSQCVEGTSGRNCLPRRSRRWYFGKVMILLFLIFGFMYAGFTLYKRFGGSLKAVTYAKLSTPADADETPNKPDDEDAITLSTDLGGDIEDPQGPTVAAAFPKQQDQQHTGLAV